MFEFIDVGDIEIDVEPVNKDGVRSKFVKTVDGFTVTPRTP